jgi:hypothetical protein
MKGNIVGLVTAGFTSGMHFGSADRRVHAWRCHTEPSAGYAIVRSYGYMVQRTKAILTRAEFKAVVHTHSGVQSCHLTITGGSLALGTALCQLLHYMVTCVQ